MLSELIHPFKTIFNIEEIRMYVLVHKNKVLVGPMKWHPSMFAGALKKLGLDLGIPRYAPRSLPLTLDYDTKIYHVQMTHVQHNPRIEYLEGPIWDFSSGTAVANYIVRAKSLDLVRGDLKAQAAKARWQKENLMSEITVKGTKVRVSISRESRANLSLLISTAADSDIIKWKSNNGVWFDLTKAELQQVARDVNNKVQELYTEEHTINNLIANAADSQELAEIEIIGRPKLNKNGF